MTKLKIESYLVRMPFVILIVPNYLPRRRKVLFCQEDDIIILLLLVFIKNLKENKILHKFHVHQSQAQIEIHLTFT